MIGKKVATDEVAGMEAWMAWAENWLKGDDRSAKSAWAVRLVASQSASLAAEAAARAAEEQGAVV